MAAWVIVVVDLPHSGPHLPRGDEALLLCIGDHAVTNPEGAQHRQYI
jgi:hypothetical protein